MTFECEVAGRTRIVQAAGPEILLDGRRFHVDVASTAHGWSLILGPVERPWPTRSYEVAVVEHAPGDLTVHVNGRLVAVRLSQAGYARPGAALRPRGEQGSGARRARPGARGEITGQGPQRVVAPMPGRIAKVLVRVGDAVAAGQGVVVVEAMKMENELRSTRAGIVTEVPAVEGALVSAHTVLVVVE